MHLFLHLVISYMGRLRHRYVHLIESSGDILFQALLLSKPINKSDQGCSKDAKSNFSVSE